MELAEKRRINREKGARRDVMADFFSSTKQVNVHKSNCDMRDLCFVAVSFLFVGFFERKGVTSVEISVLSHHKEIRKKEQVVPVGHHLSMTQRNAGNE